MVISNFFAGKAMGIHEGVDYDFMKDSGKMDNDNQDYKNKARAEKERLFGRKEGMKMKVGLGKTKDIKSNINIGRINPQGIISHSIGKKSSRQGVMHGINNVKDLLSVKSGNNTFKANVLLSMNKSSSKKSGFNVGNYLPGNKRPTGSNLDVNKYISGNKKPTGSKLDVNKYLPGNKKPTGLKSGFNPNKFLQGNDKSKISKQSFDVNKYLPGNKSKTGSFDVKKLVSGAKQNGNGTNMSKFLGRPTKKNTSLMSKTKNKTLDTFNARKTISQFTGLGGKPFGDYDGDGVSNILDCRPKNKAKQGFFDVFRGNKQNQSISGPEDFDNYEENIEAEIEDEIQKPSYEESTDHDQYPDVGDALENTPEEVLELDTRKEVRDWIPKGEKKESYGKGLGVGLQEGYHTGIEEGHATGIKSAEDYQKKQDEIDTEIANDDKPGFIESITGGRSIKEEIKARIGEKYRAARTQTLRERAYTAGEKVYKTQNVLDKEGKPLANKDGSIRTEQVEIIPSTYIKNKTQIKMDLAKERERARISEQYGTGGHDTNMRYPGETATQYNKRIKLLGGTGSKSKKPKGMIGQTSEAFSQGLGGFGGEGAAKISRMTGQSSTGRGVAMMSGALQQPMGPTGFQTIGRSQGQQDDKVRRLVGTSKFTPEPPEPQQMAYAPQPQQYAAPGGVYSEASGKVVGYKRGSYNKRPKQQVIYMEPQQ